MRLEHTTKLPANVIIRNEWNTPSASGANGYSAVFLWTTSNLTAAVRLYQSFGFHLTEEKTHDLWGATVIERRYELSL